MQPTFVPTAMAPLRNPPLASATVPVPSPSAKLPKVLCSRRRRQMLMPLMPMHVPLAVPIPPSDAVANPTATPDATAVRSRPLGILSLELTLRISIRVLAFPERFLNNKTVYGGKDTAKRSGPDQQNLRLSKF